MTHKSVSCTWVFLSTRKTTMPCFFFHFPVVVNLFVAVSEPVSRNLFDKPLSPHLPVRYRRCNLDIQVTSALFYSLFRGIVLILVTIWGHIGFSNALFFILYISVRIYRPLLKDGKLWQFCSGISWIFQKSSSDFREIWKEYVDLEQTLC
jgi:hypothetical protein